jgi:hypothetical protein
MILAANRQRPLDEYTIESPTMQQELYKLRGPYQIVRVDFVAWRMKTVRTSLE